MSPRLGKERQGQVWERARGLTLLLSPEESRAKETTPSSAPTPRCSLFPLDHPSSPSSLLGPEPLLYKRVSHHYHHYTPPALPHIHGLCHWLRCRAAHPRTRLHSPAALCTKRMQGRGSAPDTWTPLYPAPQRGLACSVFSALGTSPGGQGQEAGNRPPPPPGSH